MKWPKLDLERIAKRRMPFLLRRAVNPYFDLERFFVDATRYQRTVLVQDDVESAWGAYYEFGVGRMRSLELYWSAYQRLTPVFDLPPAHIVGFDTFTGLPETDHPADALKGWTPGRFAMSVSDVRARAAELGMPQLELVEGKYEDTLTPALARQLQAHPPGLINIDVDYYSSTAAVLAFLRTLLVPGVLIHFDDVWSFNGDPTRGQLRAIREFNEAGPFFLAPHWLGLGSGHVYAVSIPLVDR